VDWTDHTTSSQPRHAPCHVLSWSSGCSPHAALVPATCHHHTRCLTANQPAASCSTASTLLPTHQMPHTGLACSAQPAHSCSLRYQLLCTQHSHAGGCMPLATPPAAPSQLPPGLQAPVHTTATRQPAHTARSAQPPHGWGLDCTMYTTPSATHPSTSCGPPSLCSSSTAILPSLAPSSARLPSSCVSSSWL
jgi:hypothetical protein